MRWLFSFLAFQLFSFSICAQFGPFDPFAPKRAASVAATDFVTDSFTGSDGTQLESHTGEVGATWAIPSYAALSDIEILSNRIHADVEDVSSFYYASGTPPSADYYVQATVFCETYAAGEFNYAGVLGRASSAAYTCYIFYYSMNDNMWNLERVVAGMGTSLGTSSQVLVNGTSYVIKLTFSGTTIKGFVDSGSGFVEILSVTDSAISSAGTAQLFVRQGSGGSGRLHLDTFSAR